MARKVGRDGLVHVGCLPSDATTAITRPATTTPAASDTAAPTRFVLLASIPAPPAWLFSLLRSPQLRASQFLVFIPLNKPGTTKRHRLDRRHGCSPPLGGSGRRGNVRAGPGRRPARDHGETFGALQFPELPAAGLQPTSTLSPRRAVVLRGFRLAVADLGAAGGVKPSRLVAISLVSNALVVFLQVTELVQYEEVQPGQQVEYVSQQQGVPQNWQQLSPISTGQAQQLAEGSNAFSVSDSAVSLAPGSLI
jgi:hypothetical protein